jgi:Glycerol uptake facilitator and related permeases (Major Intrinsic Protein Family)
MKNLLFLIQFNCFIQFQVFWIGPFLGGSLAALVYKVFFYVNTDSYEKAKKGDDLELAQS